MHTSRVQLCKTLPLKLHCYEILKIELWHDGVKVSARFLAILSNCRRLDLFPSGDFSEYIAPLLLRFKMNEFMSFFVIWYTTWFVRLEVPLSL